MSRLNKTETPVWERAVHLAVASGVFDGVFLCCPFCHEMFWMRAGAYLSQFFEGFPTYSEIFMSFMCFLLPEDLHSELICSGKLNVKVTLEVRQ